MELLKTGKKNFTLKKQKNLTLFDDVDKKNYYSNT